MKTREKESYDTGGKRVGGWGMVEVDDAKKKWIYADEPEVLQRKMEKAEEKKAKKEGASAGFEKISRYEMATKRIW